MDCDSEQFKGSFFGFECYRVEGYIGVDTELMAIYGTITDGYICSRHTAGYSQANS